jgi:hypothetical protein
MDSLLQQIDDGRTHLIIEYLTQTESPDLRALVRAAAQYADLSAMKLLLERGATISQLHPYALNTAAFHGHLDLCELLIASGMNVDDYIAETGETSVHSVFGLPYSATHDAVLRVWLDARGTHVAICRLGSKSGPFHLDGSRSGVRKHQDGGVPNVHTGRTKATSALVGTAPKYTAVKTPAGERLPQPHVVFADVMRPVRHPAHRPPP